MPRIVVDCQSGNWLGKDVDILVDGRERAHIGRGERADMDIEPGGHVLQARFWKSMTQPLYFRAEEHETIGFDCIVSGLLRKSVMLTHAFRQRSDQRFRASQRELTGLDETRRDAGD